MEDAGAAKKGKRTQATVEEESGSSDLKAMSLDDLETLLNDVLEQEDYIRAIAIRDEIKNRRGKS
jgi:protein-arginine kinase activator protein McsA